jgi:hypothetical protein
MAILCCVAQKAASAAQSLKQDDHMVPEIMGQLVYCGRGPIVWRQSSGLNIQGTYYYKTSEDLKSKTIFTGRFANAPSA